MQLASLVDYLANLTAPYLEQEWHGWHIRPVPSGNNLLFRTTCPAADLAVKLMIRDERNRAQRELASLTLIDRLDAEIGPRPVLLDLSSHQHVALVQTWLTGQPLESPPDDDVTWLQILQTYRSVHHVQPMDIVRQGIELGPVVNPLPPDQAVDIISDFAHDLPEQYQSSVLSTLLQRLGQIRLPKVRQTSCWCHGDPNIRNVVITASGARLVDWEYSGIGDPAQELAKLMTHPVAINTTEERWQWVAEQYARLTAETDVLLRIQVSYVLQLAWWCVRLLFGQHVLLRRASHRLVGARAEEEISTLENIERYFSRTQAQLALMA